MAGYNFLREEYGLKKGTSFKSKSATVVDLKSWIAREAALKKWDKILEDSKKTPKSNFLVFIIGDYGMGKTLSLLRIKEEAKKKGLYPIYITFKSEEKTAKPGLDFIQRIFKAINFDDIKVSNAKIDRLKSIHPDVGNVFQRIIGGYPNVFGKKKINHEKKLLAISVLSGEIVPTQKQLKDLGAIRKIDRIDVAKEYLIGLLYLLKESGFSTLVIAADEFEYLFSIVVRSQQPIYLAVLRALFDLPVNIPSQLISSTANMTFFVAVSDDGWRRLDDLGKKERSTGGPIIPLKKRVTEIISLRALSKEDTKNLIEKRLSFDRVVGKYKRKPLIPYTEDFVKYIFDLTLGVPRVIIECCDHVLDMGLEKRVPRLNAEFAKEVFKERGLPY